MNMNSTVKLITSVIVALTVISTVRTDESVVHSVSQLEKLIADSSFSNALVVKYYSSR